MRRRSAAATSTAMVRLALASSTLATSSAPALGPSSQRAITTCPAAMPRTSGGTELSTRVDKPVHS